jgi:hypothetical protein
MLLRELYPVNPFPCFTLGEVHETLGQRDRALEWYRAALDRAPEGRQIRSQARAKIDQLSSAAA